jgi:cytoskeleton protein RodZ
VFEIGNSLREARQRQGLELARVEDATKIRAKYLQALEDERFDVLPAETYVKGFLRTYGEFLGLDGQLYVDEFNSRFARVEDTPVASTPPPRPRRRASESSFVVVALAGIVAVAILVVVAFTLANDDGSGDAGSRLAGTQAPTGQSPSPPSGGAATAPQPGATPARLVLQAARGSCWVEVRRNAPDGELLFAGTIERGRSMRFTGKRLWLVFGTAPSENLDVRLNGRRVRNFPVGEPVVIVSSRGIRAQT